MSKFRYSVGPWNVAEGADVYGPATRATIAFAKKVETFKRLGFDAVQFHDDDAVPEINGKSAAQISAKAKEVKKLLDNHGMAAEFVAPRLWMDEHCIDGAYTSNSAADRKYAIDRSLKSIDIARELGCNKIVLWLAREGTSCAESKDPVVAIKHLVEAVNAMLSYDKTIKILIEPKPNEPVDRSYCGTIGHVMGVSAATVDPTRVGGLLESAHAILAGLDPANEIAFGLAMGKLWGVHLNDQNGLKFDQDRSFGVENLRQGFNQIKVLVENDYGKNGEYIGLDVKAMRTTKDSAGYEHLSNSLTIAKLLEEKALKFDYGFQNKCVAERNYEALEMSVVNLLLRG